MELAQLLSDLFGRIGEHVDEVLDGLDEDWLPARVVAGTNPIGWLLWHLTRVQDHHISELLDEPQLWATGGWAGRFGVDPDPHNIGYGHTDADVATIRPDGVAALSGYYSAVAARTQAYLSQLTPADLDRIVDRRWDPPVSLGVRLISIVDDDIQHAGQAAYLKGLLERR